MTRYVFVLALVAVGCSSEDGGTSSSSTSSSSTSSGGTSSGGASADGGTDAGGGGGTVPAGECQPTGGLAVPAAGTKITATFSEAAGFNGSTAPFDSVGPGGAVSNTTVKESRVVAVNATTPKFGDNTGQTITVTFEAPAVACKTYTTKDTPPSTVTPIVSLGDNAQGLWWCGGTLVVDTVEGLAVTYHFDTVCKPNPVGNPSTGTVRLTGKGASTLAPKD